MSCLEYSLGQYTDLLLTRVVCLVLKTGLTPSASGSAYLELEQSAQSITQDTTFGSKASALKLTCTVHGPRPLPRSAAFTPYALLSTHIKFAPFASRQRRGYLRDASERDLAAHLETALRGAIIGDRWPKSGVEVIVTVLEGEEASWWQPEPNATESLRGGANLLGMMTILSGCITVASAAIADAGIDCVDLVSGGVAAIVRQPSLEAKVSSQHGTNDNHTSIVLDPAPFESKEIIALCVVGYLRSRDEISEVWMSGSTSALPQSRTDGESSPTLFINAAVQAAVAARHVLVEAIKESTELKLKRTQTSA